MNNPADWLHVGFRDNTVPDSCCKEIPAQSRCDLNSIHVNSDGCMMKLQSAIENNAMILGGVGIGVALIQVSSDSNYRFSIMKYILNKILVI